MLWISYIVTTLLSAAFGFFLQHFPRGGCYWLGGWLGYLIAANLFYNVLFSFIETKYMIIFWLFTIAPIAAIVFLLWKVKREDKTFHLIWQAPIFGGYLCALSILIYA